MKRATEALDASHAIILDSNLLRKMAPIKAHIKELAELQQQLKSDWSLLTEQTYRIPNTRKKIKSNK